MVIPADPADLLFVKMTSKHVGPNRAILCVTVFLRSKSLVVALRVAVSYSYFLLLSLFGRS